MAYYITTNCIGCTLCAKQCPTGAISGAAKHVHVVDPDLCIDCGLCGKLCPKSAIQDRNGLTANKVAKKDWIKPSIDRDTCVGCSLCVENCPMDCLEIEGPQYHGDIETLAALTDEDACISCRICEAACPIGAITFEAGGADDSAGRADGAADTRAADGSTAGSDTAAGKTITIGNADLPVPTKDDAYRAFCRTYQGVFKIGMYAIPWGMPETLEGSGSVRKLPAWIREKGFDNVLVVTDKGLMGLGLLDSMFDAMKEAGVQYTVYDGVQPNPTNINVEEGLKLFRENGCQAMVAFGGGSRWTAPKGSAPWR